MNNTELVHSYQCVPTLNEISHHYIVEIATSYNANVDVNLNQSGSKGTLDDFNYFGENIEWTEINRVIRNHDWVMEFKDLPPYEKLDRFLRICHKLSETYVPKEVSSREEAWNTATREKDTNAETWKNSNTSKDQLIRIERELL